MANCLLWWWEVQLDEFESLSNRREVLFCHHFRLFYPFFACFPVFFGLGPLPWVATRPIGINPWCPWGRCRWHPEIDSY